MSWSERPLVGILMGSKNDYSVMSEAVKICEELGIPCEARVLSAHRTPDEALDYAANAAARGSRVLIAGAGGAAHLAGILAAALELPKADLDRVRGMVLGDAEHHEVLGHVKVGLAELP